MVQAGTHWVRPDQLAVDALQANTADPPITLVDIRAVDQIGGRRTLGECASLVPLTSPALIPLRRSFDPCRSRPSSVVLRAQTAGPNWPPAVTLRAHATLMIECPPMLTPRRTEAAIPSGWREICPALSTWDDRLRLSLIAKLGAATGRTRGGDRRGIRVEGSAAYQAGAQQPHPQENSGTADCG